MVFDQIPFKEGIEFLHGHVMFAITTDGMENASREFSYEKARRMIEHQKSKYDWEFIFSGSCQEWRANEQMGCF